jgi:hypothetical protein
MTCRSRIVNHCGLACGDSQFRKPPGALERFIPGQKSAPVGKHAAWDSGQFGQLRPVESSPMRR